MSKAKYYTDGKRVVVCTITVKSNGNHELASGTFIGRAYCHESDKFDFELGKEIAYERALLKLKKEEKRQQEINLNWLKSAYEEYKIHEKVRDYQDRRIAQINFNLEALLAKN